MLEGPAKRFLTFLLVIFSLQASSQKISVDGGFVEDSLLIGQDVHFYLSATYPPQMEMVFPDSLFSFSPFEFSSKTYFPTQVRDSLAFDSTVYALQSFEIEKVQYLQLPAVILTKGDSVIFQSPNDSIYLTELAPVVTDSTSLRTNLDYLAVDQQFNYPLLYYVLGGLIILVIIFLVVFGKKIIKWIKLRRLRKQFEEFATRFSGLVKKMKVDPDPAIAEQALIQWKNYQQKLENEPFAVLTTKEILSYSYTQELDQPLKAIDRVVYGKKAQEDIYQDFEQIDSFVMDRYSKKVEKIKNAK